MPPAYEQCVFQWPSVIVNRIIDTSYWKYYIAPTSFHGKYIMEISKTVCKHVVLVYGTICIRIILSYLRILKMSFQALCIICTSIKYEFIFMCNAFTAICKSLTLIFFWSILAPCLNKFTAHQILTQFEIIIFLNWALSEHRFHNLSRFMLFKNIFCYD